MLYLHPSQCELTERIPVHPSHIRTLKQETFHEQG